MKKFNFFEKLWEHGRTLRRVGLVLVMCLTLGVGNVWGTDYYTPSSATETIIIASGSNTMTSHSALSNTGTFASGNKKCGDPATVYTTPAATGSNVNAAKVKKDSRSIVLNISGCSEIVLCHESLSSSNKFVATITPSGESSSTEESSASTYFTTITLNAAKSYTIDITNNNTGSDYYIYAVVLKKGSAATPRTFKSGEKIYFKDASVGMSNLSNELWKKVGKDLYAYFWNPGSDGVWTYCSVVVEKNWNETDAIYEITVPGVGQTYEKMFFGRGIDSNKKEKYTTDESPQKGKNLFYISNSKYGDAFQGSWGNFTPASKTIYFDNRIVTDWTTAYVRIGKNNNVNAWGPMTKVGGTRNLYSQSTSKYASHSDFAIANKAGWTGDNNHIDQPEKTHDNGSWSSSSYKMTLQTNYQEYAIDSDVYICPKATSVLEYECQFYQITDANSTTSSRIDSYTTGMRLPQYRVTSSGTHCTVTMVKYTNDALTTSESLSSGGTVKPTQYIGVTVTPDAGYKFKSVSLSDGKYIEHTAAAAGVTGKYAIMDNACVVTAVCDEDTYTITYKDGGNTDFSGSLEDGSPTTHTYGTATTLKTATKDGYSFGGWYTKSDFSGNSKVTSLAATTYTANITLYAQWTKDVYLKMGDKWDEGSPWFAIYFWKAGGSATGWAEMKLADVCSDPAIYKAPLPMDVYDKLIFVQMDPTKEDLEWASKLTYQTEDLTYPSSSNFQYTITDNDGGASGKSIGSWGAYSIPTFTIKYKEGSTTYTSGNSISGSKDNESKTCAIDFTLPSSAVFTTTGYTQTSWTKSDGGSQTHALGGSYTDNEAATFYPVWTPQVYAITYKDGGDVAFSGTHETGYPTSHTYGTATTLKTASKDGYTFGGWFDNASCTDDEVTSIGAKAKTAAFTLYAKWTCTTPTFDTDLSTSEIVKCKDEAKPKLTVAASANGGDISYQWYSNTTNSTSDPTALTDSTKATMCPPTSAAGTLYYFCKATNTTDECTTYAYSNITPVTVTGAATITWGTQPANGTVGDDDFAYAVSCSDGSSVTVTSNNTGVATIVDGKLHYVAAGTTYLIATATDACGNEIVQNSNNFTVSAALSDEKKLLGLKFSNGFDAFIDETYHTVTAYYLYGTSAPTVSSHTESDDATYSKDGNTITITAEDGTTQDYTLTLSTVTPYAGTGSEETFTGSETYIKGGIWEDSEWNIRKNSNDDDRQQKGLNRLYFFIDECSTITLTSSCGNSRNIYVYRNGTKLDSPTSIGTSGATIEIAGSASPALYAILPNGTNGDIEMNKIMITPNCTSPGLAFASASKSVTLCDDAPTNALTNTHGVTVSYESSNTSVAEVASDGTITLVGAGETTITASAAEQTISTTTYCEDNASYTITVTAGTAAGLAYGTSTVKKDVGDDAFTNTLTNSNGLTVTYTSSDEDVATIDSDGEVTIKAAGTTTITARSAQQKVSSTCYAAGSATYTLTVYPVYTVTYNAMGGTCGTSSANTSLGNVTLPTPTYGSRTFEGWYTTAGVKAGNAGASYSPTGNITLYAKWTGSCAADAPTLSIGASEVTTSTFLGTYSTEGITLSSSASWDSDGYVELNSTPSAYSGNHYFEVLASSTDIEKVSFLMTGNGRDKLLQGPAFGWETTATSNTADTYRILDAETVSDKGYSNAQWFTYDFSESSVKCIRLYRATKSISSLSPEYTGSSTQLGGETVFIYGVKVWLKGGGGGTCYQVTYNSNGAESGYVNDTMQYASGATVCVKLNNLERTGYAPNGWNTKADGSGTKIGCFNITRDTTLYAQWKYVIDSNNEDFAGYAAAPTQYQDVLVTDSATLTIKDLTTPTMHDITITKGAKLKLQKGTSVHDITVETGSTLNITTTDGTNEGTGITLAANSLALKGGWDEYKDKYDMPRVYIHPKCTLTRTEPVINFDISVDFYNYYPIALPFDVPVSRVDYAESYIADVSIYGEGGHYAIREYDGEEHAVGNAAWKYVGNAVTDTLKAGKGYILYARTVGGKGIIRFPMTVDNAWTAGGEKGSATISAKTVTKNIIDVTAYGWDPTAKEGTGDWKDGVPESRRGWNLLGVPYMSCFNTGADMYSGGGAAELITGRINYKDYKWEESEIRYVTIPKYDFSEYIQANIADDDTVTTLLPGWCFFVQVGKSGKLTFLAENDTVSGSWPIYAPKREQENMPTLKTGIILTGNGAKDKTNFLISDKYSASEYEINADLEKMFGENSFTLATYSLSGETRLAYNALSNADARNIIPVGYRAPADGDYTFSINPRYAENGAFEHVNLIDYETGIMTDLLQYSYTFSTERTQLDTRFALNVVPRKETPTDIENGASGINDANGPRKVLINDKMYIIIDGKMYDATGKAVK